jgi:DNA/RNA non-specific endonuclease
MSVLGSVMSALGSVGHGLSDAGGFVVHGAEDGAKAVAGVAQDGAKAVASGVEDGWKSAFNGAKAAVGALGTGVRSLDAAKQQVGSWIDSGEKYLENKVDQGRAWLRQNGGIAGQMASDQIGFAEGVGVSVYDAGKGLVQLADEAGSLTNPIEWAANPSANIARLKSTVNTAETLGRIANLANPTSWMTDPQGNAQLAGGLWHSAATSFENDPSKFIGNAVGTIGTLFIPGADVGAAAGDVGRTAALVGDAGKLADATETAGRIGNLAGDAGKAADAGKLIDAGRAADSAANATHVVQLDDAAALKAAAEHPAPNTRYDFGNYSWTTDARGRPIVAEGRVELTPAGRDTALQEQIGKEGAPTDVGFHLIGDRFNGPTNRLNVVPGNGKLLGDGLPNLNQGAYKRFENQIAKLAADPHNAVDVRVMSQYDAGNLTTRPDEFAVAYRVNDGRWVEREFVNKR